MPAKRVLFDQMILGLTIPNDLSPFKVTRLRRALRATKFPQRLRRLVRTWLRESPAFADVTITVSR